MCEMNPFTKIEWDGFAGADEEEGRPALIGDITVEGWGAATIIADINGVQVIVADDGEQLPGIWNLDGRYWVNVLVARALPISLGQHQLEAWGFQRIA